MESNNQNLITDRRSFIGSLTAGAVAMSMAGVVAPLVSVAKEPTNNLIDDSDVWFTKLKGKHKIVFDVTEPHEIFPFAWPRVFLMTNELTGTKEKDNGVVVILRHAAIPYAMEDKLWAKYKFGELFKANDPMTKAPAVRNPFWQPKAGDFKVPGIGNVAIGINELQKSGVMFCVCNVALTVYSNVAADSMNMKAEDVKKEWVAGILPGIQIVPSGVWAVGRAQERGAGYCFAG
jgi:intracellular sulfur oxidation DsrE/DsrF family protein